MNTVVKKTTWSDTERTLCVKEVSTPSHHLWPHPWYTSLVTLPLPPSLLTSPTPPLSLVTLNLPHSHQYNPTADPYDLAIVQASIISA